ncbi:MAG: glycosyltransferase [Phycisphaerae bacterium]|nr:glycosyltransferase [Phycisphaerae bacterium]
MRIFMLGWEFPPFISGGLGTACYGLTRGLDRRGVEVLFVLPRPVEDPDESHVRIVSPASAAIQIDADDEFDPLPGLEGMFQHAKFRSVAATLRPYARPEALDAAAQVEVSTRGATSGKPGPRRGTPVITSDEPPTSTTSNGGGPGAHYAGDLFSEVERYAVLARRVARQEDFDLIHAHDWMTYLAGIAVARQSGKPLVVHVHSTEFDRSGLHVNQRIYDIERAGMHAATRIICVSHLTRNVVLKHYGVDPRKVEVVYNAVDDDGNENETPLPPITRDEKIVLFLGRITMQKGPEYFLAAARRVLEVMDNVRFVMAGSGDMTRRMIELAAEMGIGHKVLFPGFLRGDDIRRVFNMADLYVMPSVSEPFGITPLEALSHDVPVLISKQSGVAEVLAHALKVDFWDVDEMANKIVAVLRHPPLSATLRDHGSFEVSRFSWTDSAANCVKVYETALGREVS